MKAENWMKALALLILLVFQRPLDLSANDLVDAVMEGNLDKVKEVASRGGDLNERQQRGGRTSLIWASLQGRKEIVKFLISKGADINLKDEEGYSALMIACWADQKEIVDLLANKGADLNLQNVEGKTALMISLHEFGKEEIAQILISKGADVNIKDKYGNTALGFALGSNKPEMAKLLISKGADVNTETRDGGGRFATASARGMKEIVELIVSKGVNDASKNRALMSAAGEGHKEVVDILAAKGADVNYKGFYGKTPLMSASRMGKNKTAELLILSGANVNATDYYGMTPLMFAVEEKHVVRNASSKIPSSYYTRLAGRKDVVELLISKGAFVDAQDYRGRTALMFAATNGLKEIAKVLLLKGADKNLKDNRGNTALTYARKAKDPELARLITSSPGPKEPAKSRRPPDLPAHGVDAEIEKARETLVRFFDYLHEEQYGEAARLFEPVSEELEQSKGWVDKDWFAQDAETKASTLRSYYVSAGIRLKASVLDVRKVDNEIFRLTIQFIMDNGEVFVYGPCCGATEEMMPPETEFAYFVKKTQGTYKVGTFPLYVP